MGDVTAVNMDVVTESSGHAFTPMAVSVCLTPAAPSPLPIPYPVTSTSTQGVTDMAMRTKIDGANVITVGSVFTVCHGNEPGTLKEVVSLNTSGPCFIVMGAPTVICELGFMGITNSPGFLNKQITVGAPGMASGAGGAGAGGGGGDGGGGGGGDGDKKSDSNSGSGGGGSSSAATAKEPTKEELAAQENANPDDGKNAARKAARKEVARDFYKKHGQKWDPDKKDPKTGKKGVLRKHTDAELNSELKCIDFDKPVKPGVTPPPDKAYQWQAPGRQKPPGQYFNQDPTSRPKDGGIGNYGVSRPDGKVTEKIQTPYDIPPGTNYLQSTASPAKDTWSVGKGSPGLFQNGMTQSAPGGKEQTYIPTNGGLSPSGPSKPLW